MKPNNLFDSISSDSIFQVISIHGDGTTQKEGKCISLHTSGWMADILNIRLD